MITFTHKAPAAVLDRSSREMHPLDHVEFYLIASGPTRYWAISANLADIGVTFSPEDIEHACSHFPGTFLVDRDHIGPLIGIRTEQWRDEVSTRRSLDTRAAVKEQRLPRLRRGMD